MLGRELAAKGAIRAKTRGTLCSFLRREPLASEKIAESYGNLNQVEDAPGKFVKMGD